jgi:hypothetical protein
MRQRVYRLDYTKVGINEFLRADIGSVRVNDWHNLSIACRQITLSVQMMSSPGETRGVRGDNEDWQYANVLSRFYDFFTLLHLLLLIPM